MSHFDLHMHPVFKQAICEFEKEYPTKRKSADLIKHFDLAHGFAEWLDENVLHILESQCCVDQFAKDGPVYGVAAIAPIERFFTDRSGVFGKLLNGPFTDPFDKTYMNTIRDGGISYYQLYLKELDLYRQLQRDGVLNWVTRRERDGLDAKKGLHLVLGMEGGHALCRSLIGRPGEKDTPVPLTGKADSAWEKFSGDPMHPADGLKQLQQSLWEDDMDLFYLTLTHLSHIGDQFLATHAYGMKMIDTPESYPQGNGISAMGKEVVKAAYEMTVTVKEKGKNVEYEAPVLIDMKHMGLKSRLDLYELRASMKAPLPPLLATHMGVTGYTVDEWKSALIGNTARVHHDPRSVGFTIERQQAGKWGVLNKRFSYNAWSINLMDDDIVKVIESGGLIGISLDVRILGWQDALHKDDVEEFMSPDDFRYFFPKQYARIFNKPVGVESMAAEEDWFKPTKEERHPLALCFNLLHVASVGMVAGHADAWDHICIGSDFDGLIDPVKNVSNVSQMGELRPLLMRWLPEAEETYRKHHGGPPLIVRKNKEADLKKLETLVEKILHTNGVDFLKNKWT